MIYDITDETNPRFLQYTNTRDFTVPVADTDAGPEGVQFLDEEHSPTGQPLVVVSHEVSGSIQIYAPVDPDGAGTLSLLHNNDGETALFPQTSARHGRRRRVGDEDGRRP